MKITCVNCQSVFPFDPNTRSTVTYCPNCYYQNQVAQPPQAILRLTTTDGSIQEFELGFLSTIGRHPNNTIQVMDRMISKQHVEVSFNGTDFILNDLSSRNGTFINNEQIKEKTLASGDEIQVGSARLFFIRGAGSLNKTQQVVVIDQDDSPVAAICHQPADKEFLPENQLDTESLRKDYEKLRVAHELNRKIGSELKLGPLLEQVLEEIFSTLNADRGAILLMNERGELIPNCSKARDEESLKEDNISIPGAILKSVIEKRAGVISSDAKIDERFSRSESIIVQGIRSAMCVPLIAKVGGEVLGAIHLDTQSAIGLFTEKDLQLLTVLASQAAFAIENAKLAEQIEKETVIRTHLQRFLSPAVMDRLNKDDLTIRMGGELKEATVMFTDIRGFTSLSEQYDPEELVQDLNAYFTLLVDIIFAHEGTLDKFIGDAIMAVWGTLESHPEDPLRAVQAAHEIQQQLKVFNDERATRGKPPLLTGIGINSGELVAGNMGSPKRLEFTVIGDHVNVAARLCGQAKAYEVIISHDTFNAVEKQFECEELPPATVKGKAEALQIYRVEKEITSLDSSEQTKLQPLL